MKSLETITNMMAVQEYPCWKLSELRNGVEYPCGDYLGDNTPESKKAYTVESGVARLRSTVAAIDDSNDTVFRITLCRTPNSHKGGELGPFDFTQKGGQPSQAAQGRADNPLAGLLQGGGLAGLEGILAVHTQRVGLETQATILNSQLSGLKEREDTLRERERRIEEDRQAAKREGYEEGLRRAEMEMAPTKIKLEFEKERIKDLHDDLKDEIERVSRGDDRMLSRGEKLFDLLAARFGLDSEPTPELSGVESAEEDPHAQRCMELADFVYEVGSPGYTEAVFKYAERLKERGAGNGTV